jgi:hypothetical protein
MNLKKSKYAGGIFLAIKASDMSTFNCQQTVKAVNTFLGGGDL